MEGATDIGASTLEGIVFVGQSLGPFFRYDPQREAKAIGQAYGAIAGLEPRAAAAEWPFVAQDRAFHALCLMQEGLEDDFDGTAVAREYKRLFVGPAAKAAPPWGSVYTDKDGVMFGESWVALREWMRIHGVQVLLGGRHEPEDHIGIMLEMMAWIAMNRPADLADYLRLHVLTWAGRFLEGMRAAAQQPFFEGLAELTAASLAGIQEELALEIELPRFYR